MTRKRVSMEWRKCDFKERGERVMTWSYVLCLVQCCRSTVPGSLFSKIYGRRSQFGNGHFGVRCSGFGVRVCVRSVPAEIRESKIYVACKVLFNLPSPSSGSTSTVATVIPSIPFCSLPFFSFQAAESRAEY